VFLHFNSNFADHFQYNEGGVDHKLFVVCLFPEYDGEVAHYLSKFEVNGKFVS